MNGLAITMTLIFASASLAEMNPDTATPVITALEVSRMTGEECIVSFEVRKSTVDTNIYITVHREGDINHVTGYDFRMSSGPARVAWRVRNLVPNTPYTVSVRTDDADAVEMKFSTAPHVTVGLPVLNGGSFLAEYSAPHEDTIASMGEDYVRCIMRIRIDVSHMPIDSEGITGLWRSHSFNQDHMDSIPLWIGIEIQPGGLYMTALYAVKSRVPLVVKPLPPKKG